MNNNIKKIIKEMSFNNRISKITEIDNLFINVSILLSYIFVLICVIVLIFDLIKKLL